MDTPVFLSDNINQRYDDLRQKLDAGHGLMAVWVKQGSWETVVERIRTETQYLAIIQRAHSHHAFQTRFYSSASGSLNPADYGESRVVPAKAPDSVPAAEPAPAGGGWDEPVTVRLTPDWRTLVPGALQVRQIIGGVCTFRLFDSHLGTWSPQRMRELGHNWSELTPYAQMRLSSREEGALDYRLLPVES